MTRRWWSGLVTVLLGCVATAAAIQDKFDPVRPGDVTESLPAAPLIYVAYAFVWVWLLSYVFMLWRKVGRVERELAELGGKLKAARRG